MKKYEKQNESGRSMVEMLGTLAIIGMLSIGGVTGYGRAVTAYRTNSAVETAQKQAAIVAGEVAMSPVSPGTATVLKSPSGYEIAVKDVKGGVEELKATTPNFAVEVGGGSGKALPREVAKSIVERAADDWKAVHAIGVKSSSGGTSTITWLKSAGTGSDGFEGVVPENTQTVVIIIVFATDLSLREGTLSDGADLTTGGEEGQDGDTCTEECGPCQICENGECVADASKDTLECTIDNFTGTCDNGTCSLGCTEECGPCQICENGECNTDWDKNGQTCFVDNVSGTCNDDGICVISECSSDNLSACTNPSDCEAAFGFWGTGPDGMDVCCAHVGDNTLVGGTLYGDYMNSSEYRCVYYCDTASRASCDQISCQSALSPESYWDYDSGICREYITCPESPCTTMCEKAMIDQFESSEECAGCTYNSDSRFGVTEWIDGHCIITK